MLLLDEARAVHLEAFEFYKNVKIPALIQIIPAELCADCALIGSREDARMYALQALATDEYFILLSSRLAHWYVTEALVHDGEIERAAHDCFVQAATIVRMLADALGSEKQRINFLTSPLVIPVSKHGAQRW